jgi:iron complex transport system ATP-binding protein
MVCRLFGQETWDVFDLRSRFGIVSNDLQAAYARPITAFEVILSGFFSSIGLWPAHRVTPAMETKARAILERLEVAHLADRPLREMSSGEARRLLIGRALVHDPIALLLDEPTNSLDFRAAHEFRAIVRKLAREGHTIVMVTHTIADVIPEITRAVLLKAGRIHRDGPVAELLSTPLLSELFDLPLRVVREEGRYGIW